MNSFYVHLPENQNLPLNHEYCIVEIDNQFHTIRFHDYKKVFSIPGFYEYLFHQKLKCNSPETVCKLLKREVDKTEDIKKFIALDLGAGNGIVGEQLQCLGIKTIYGIDIIKEAARAVKRDRPNIYKKYYVKDLSKTSSLFYKKLNKKNINCMTAVSSLGFDDIPVEAFVAGFNVLTTPAWLAFNIKEEFLTKNDTTGFSLLIRKILDNKIFNICLKKKYRHRLSIQGKPLYYTAIIGKKKSNISSNITKEAKEYRIKK